VTLERAVAVSRVLVVKNALILPGYAAVLLLATWRLRTVLVR